MEDNVRVALRIRPQSTREINEKDGICTQVTPGEPQVTVGTQGVPKSYTFDYVFDTDAQQQEIYDTCVCKLVDGTFQGYNATVLAYGQTGTGKTYTMGTGFEPGQRPDQVGIIPRALQQLFKRICRMQGNDSQPGHKTEFEVNAQFAEIYNEQFVDLFVPGGRSKPADSKTPGSAARKGSEIAIKEERSGDIVVTGLVSEPVPNARRALELLRAGSLMRTTASTSMNDVSSRSHAIFTLHIKQYKNNRKEVITSKFHFVDLAGSERLKRTEATGHRAKESAAINGGLMCLAKVISALAEQSRKGKRHIPYRDSKLTRMLQDSLGGNSNTLMISCISPSDRDFAESLNTLRYANQARMIKNKPIVNLDAQSKSVGAQQARILKLELELAEYRAGRAGPSAAGDGGGLQQETTMLNRKLLELNRRLKVMEEVNSRMQKRIAELEVEAGLAKLGITLDSRSQSANIMKEYADRIAELTCRLAESTKMCELLRQNASSSTSATGGAARPGDKRPRPEPRVEDFLDDDVEAIDADILQLTRQIMNKGKLLEEYEIAMQKIVVAGKTYMTSVQQLQTRLCKAEKERDAANSGPNGDHAAVQNMDREICKLKAAINKRQQQEKFNQHVEMKVMELQREAEDMQTQKVELVTQLKEAKRRKETGGGDPGVQRREDKIARKQKIREMRAIKNALKAEHKSKEAHIKAMREGVPYAPNVGPRSEACPVSAETTCKWNKIQAKIDNLSIQNKAVAHMEQVVATGVASRGQWGCDLANLEQRRQLAVDPAVKAELEEQIKAVKDSLRYAAGNMADAQEEMVALDNDQDELDTQEVGDMVTSVDEARYLVEKLYEVAVNQGAASARKDMEYAAMEARLKEVEHQNNLLKVTMENIYDRQRLINAENVVAAIESSRPSSRSASHGRRTRARRDETVMLEELVLNYP